MSFNLLFNTGFVIVTGFLWMRFPVSRRTIAVLYVLSGVFSLIDLPGFVADGNLSGVGAATFWVAVGVAAAYWYSTPRQQELTVPADADAQPATTGGLQAGAVLSGHSDNSQLVTNNGVPTLRGTFSIAYVTSHGVATFDDIAADGVFFAIALPTLTADLDDDLAHVTARWLDTDVVLTADMTLTATGNGLKFDPTNGAVTLTDNDGIRMKFGRNYNTPAT
jgi:hypothetical protein